MAGVNEPDSIKDGRLPEARLNSLQKWTAHRMPDQTGRVVTVTSTDRGTAIETALAMANKGVTVVMAWRKL